MLVCTVGKSSLFFFTACKIYKKNQVTIREVIPEKWLGIGLVEHLNLSGVHMLMQALEKW